MPAGTPFVSEQEALSRSFDSTADGLRSAPMTGVLKATAQTVGTSAAALVTALAGRKVIMIKPASDIQIGESAGVTTATGFTITANTTLTLEVGPGVAIFAIAAGAGVNVRVLEIS